MKRENIIFSRRILIGWFLPVFFSLPSSTSSTTKCGGMKCRSGCWRKRAHPYRICSITCNLSGARGCGMYVFSSLAGFSITLFPCNYFIFSLQPPRFLFFFAAHRFQNYKKHCLPLVIFRCTSMQRLAEIMLLVFCSFFSLLPSIQKENSIICSCRWFCFLWRKQQPLGFCLQSVLR